MAGFFGQVDQDGTGFEKFDHLAFRSVGIDQGRDLVVGVKGQELGTALFSVRQAHQVGIIVQSKFFQCDRGLYPVRCGKGIKLNHVGAPGWPAICNGMGGQGHNGLRNGVSVTYVVVPDWTDPKDVRR